MRGFEAATLNVSLITLSTAFFQKICVHKVGPKSQFRNKQSSDRGPRVSNGDFVLSQRVWPFYLSTLPELIFRYTANFPSFGYVSTQSWTARKSSKPSDRPTTDEVRQSVLGRTECCDRTGSTRSSASLSDGPPLGKGPFGVATDQLSSISLTQRNRTPRRSQV